MLTKSISCAIFIFYFNVVALCSPVGFEEETSPESQNITKSLASETDSNRIDVPRVTDISNVADLRHDISTVKPKHRESVTATTDVFKGKTIISGIDATDLPFNDDNSITDVNTEADVTASTTTEFTTDFTTTEDYETTTLVYGYGDILRSEVSPQIFASLLG